MIKLDEQEVKIVKNLIKDPRASDNAIAKETKIPVMTVNRKRKRLEKSGLLYYYAHLKTGEGGTHLFHATQLYIVRFSSGHTTKEYLEYLDSSRNMYKFNSKHIMESYLGEQDGRLALIMILKAETEAQMTEIFNGIIINNIKKVFGENCINSISTVKITLPVRLFHNYMPSMNMENGKMKKDWPDEWIFADAASSELKETAAELAKLNKIRKEMVNSNK